MGHRVIIGNESNPDNHIKLSDRSVSRSHASAEIGKDDRILLKDNNSTYGTFVNGRQIKSKIVTSPDMITFGHTTFSGKELLLECRKILMHDKVHWEEEFMSLKDHFLDYEKKKKRLRNKHNIKLGAARVAVFGVFFFVFSYAFKSLGIDAFYRTILIIGASMAAAVIAGFFVRQDRLTENLRSIEEKYEDILKCPNPKCGYSLKSKSFSYWKNKRKCPKCQANWVVV